MKLATYRLTIRTYINLAGDSCRTHVRVVLHRNRIMPFPTFLRHTARVMEDDQGDAGHTQRSDHPDRATRNTLTDVKDKNHFHAVSGTRM